MKTLLLATAALVALAVPARADGAAAPAAPPAAVPTDGGQATPAKSPQASAVAAKSAQSNARHDGDLSADMETTLRKAGFTELRIMPNSVFVRGKDKAGNPVAMVINPGSMTEMVMLDPHSGPAAGGTGATPLTGSSTFTTVLPTEKLASSLIGLAVSGTAGDTIGTIKDLAIDHGGLHAYIIGVGGLFGVGDRYVAITPSAINLTYDRAAKTYRAAMSATAEQLKAAPEFKFGDMAEAKRD